MVGFGHRIGRTLRVPGRGLRRSVVLLVVLVTAGATGSAVALSTPSVLAALHPAPAADAQPALPALALRPLAAAAPLPTEAGLTTALGKPADAVPARSPASCSTRRPTRCSGSARPAPARPRLDGEADHHGGRVAHAQPDVEPGHQGRGGRRAGRRGARRRRRSHAHRAPAGQGGVYPDPTRLTELADAGQEGDRRPDHQGDDRHQPLPRARPRAGLGRGRHRGRATSPRSPR